MSETPRTDKVESRRQVPSRQWMDALDLARALEHELGEAHGRIRELETELEQCRQKTIELASELNHRARRTGK